MPCDSVFLKMRLARPDAPFEGSREFFLRALAFFWLLFLISLSLFFLWKSVPWRGV